MGDAVEDVVAAGFVSARIECREGDLSAVRGGDGLRAAVDVYVDRCAVVVGVGDRDQAAVVVLETLEGVAKGVDDAGA